MLKPEQVKPNVICLKVSNNKIINNNYLVIDPYTKKSILIDPAWEIDKLTRAIENNSATLEGILLTHSHFDHVDLASEVSRIYGCPIWMSEAEIEFSKFYAPNLIAIDETKMKIGGLMIEPIFTPGHTPGSVCYKIGDNLFTGDVLFPEGCGMCNDLNSAHMMYRSLERLKKILNDNVRVYPGHTYAHDPGRLFSDIKRQNMYLQFTNKDRFASFRLRSGQNKKSILNFS